MIVTTTVATYLKGELLDAAWAAYRAMAITREDIASVQRQVGAPAAQMLERGQHDVKVQIRLSMDTHHTLALYR